MFQYISRNIKHRTFKQTNTNQTPEVKIDLQWWHFPTNHLINLYFIKERLVLHVSIHFCEVGNVTNY